MTTATLTPSPSATALAEARIRGRQYIANTDDLCGPLDVVFWNAQIDRQRAGATPAEIEFLDGMADGLATLLVAMS